jgi:hypothetical protein
MANYDRGIMKFRGADSPLAVALSTLVVGTVVGSLIWWALSHAYVF